MNKRPEMRDDMPTGRIEYDVDIDQANKQLATWSDWPAANREVLRRHAPDLDASLDAMLARIREIVGCHNAWLDARNAAWDAVGMDEASDAADEAHRRCSEVISEIAWCPATTLAGVMLKARAAIGCFGDTPDAAETTIDGEIGNGMDGEGLALSIVKDLARLAPQGSLGGAHA